VQGLIFTSILLTTESIFHLKENTTGSDEYDTETTAVKKLLTMRKSHAEKCLTKDLTNRSVICQGASSFQGPSSTFTTRNYEFKEFFRIVDGSIISEINYI